MMPGLDCDGVLADTERHGHLPAFNQTFRESGLPVQWSEEEYGRIRAHSSVMTATLSADHRAVDGAQAARFLASVKARLEGFGWDHRPSNSNPG